MLFEGKGHTNYLLILILILFIETFRNILAAITVPRQLNKIEGSKNNTYTSKHTRTRTRTHTFM